MLRVGIAGIGFMGMIHYLAWQRVKGARVTAIASRDEKKLAGDWRSIKGNFGPPGEQMDLTGIRTYSRAGSNWCRSGDRSGRRLPAAPSARRGDDRGPGGRQARAVRKADRARFARSAAKMMRAAEAAEPAIARRPRAALHGRVRHGLQTDRRRQVWPAAGRPFQTHHLRAEVDPRLFRSRARRRTDDRSAHPRRPFHPPAVRHAAGRFHHRPHARRGAPSCSPRNSCSTTRAWPSPPPAASFGQQGRSFTHGFEIHLERATLAYDFAVVGDQPRVNIPLTVFTADGRVAAAGRRLGRSGRCLRGRAGARRSVRSAPAGFRRCLPAAWPATRCCCARSKRPRWRPAGW